MLLFSFLMFFSIAVEPHAQIREIYIAAVEFEWDYLHSEYLDSFPSQSKYVHSAGPNSHKIIKKIVVPSYISAISAVGMRLSDICILKLCFFIGIQGPVIAAEVMDKVVVHFKNFASRPYSVHPIGISYWKQSEGAGYNDETSTQEKEDDIVAPGAYYRYVWDIAPTIGPTPEDPDCLTYSYSSHVDIVKDFNSGLIGALLICKSGTLNTDRHQNVQEFIVLLSLFDETKSWYGDGETFKEKIQNLRPRVQKQYHTINGYVNASLPGTVSCLKKKIVWHFIGMGTTPGIHSIRFQDHTLQVNNHRKMTLDVTSLTFTTAEMKPMAIGKFLIYCQIHSHQQAGMSAYFSVENCPEEKMVRKMSHDFDEDEFDIESLSNVIVIDVTNPQAKIRSSAKLKPKKWVHYIAAEEVIWDYAPQTPSEKDRILSSEYLERGPHRIGKQYKKAAYFEYEDKTFSKLKATVGEKGIVGPVLRGEVEDEFEIIFKNLASRPFNIYPQGLISIHPRVEKESLKGKDLRSYAVQPNETFAYVWKITPEDGPTKADPQCLTRFYQSTIDPIRDTASGLLGPLIICSKKTLDMRGNVISTDRERHLMFSIFDENKSWYINENIQKFCKSPSSTDLTDPEFYNSNVMYSVNGYMYNNLRFTVCLKDVAFWHAINVGTESDFLSVYFTGNTFEQDKVYKTVLTLFPMTGETVSMEPETLGEWEIGAFNDNFKKRGMSAKYIVKKCDPPVGDYDYDLEYYIDEEFSPRGAGRRNKTLSIKVCKKARSNKSQLAIDGTAVTSKPNCEVKNYIVTLKGNRLGTLKEQMDIRSEIIQKLSNVNAAQQKVKKRDTPEESTTSTVNLEEMEESFSMDEDFALPLTSIHSQMHETGITKIRTPNLQPTDLGEVVAKEKLGSGSWDRFGSDELTKNVSSSEKHQVLTAVSSTDSKQGPNANRPEEKPNQIRPSSAEFQENPTNMSLPFSDEIHINRSRILVIHHIESDEVLENTELLKKHTNVTMPPTIKVQDIGKSSLDENLMLLDSRRKIKREGDTTDQSESLKITTAPPYSNASKVSTTYLSKDGSQASYNTLEESPVGVKLYKLLSGKHLLKRDTGEEDKSEVKKTTEQPHENQVLEVEPSHKPENFSMSGKMQKSTNSSHDTQKHTQEKPNLNYSNISIVSDYDDYNEGENDTMNDFDSNDDEGIDVRSSDGISRNFFIAAVEVMWDYGIKKPQQLIKPREMRMGWQKFFPEYKKVVFRKYVDSSFKQQATRGELEEHLGILGPVIRAEINDIITVTFKNLASRPYSFHLHGVYDKMQNELHGKAGGDNEEAVQPNEIQTYSWKVTRTQGPSAKEFDCKAWAYYSNLNMEKDINSGLIGPLLICKPNTLSRVYERQLGIQEFTLLFTMFDETKSWYMDENIKNFCLPPCKAKRNDPLFQKTNTFSAINGYVAETLPGLVVAQYHTVRWHLLNMGSSGEVHSVHFHGNPFTERTDQEHRMGVYTLYPGVFGTVEMRPAMVGTWLVECMIGEYQLSGMRAKVLVYNPRCAQPLGMQTGRITDSQIISSGNYDDWKPGLARLELSGSVNAWSGLDKTSWIQVDLLKPTIIHGIRTQGARQRFSESFISQFVISHSLDGEVWKTYKGNSTISEQIFGGNFDSSSIKENYFSPPIIGRFIKLHPVNFQKRPTLRMELIGCDLNSCSLPLGMEKGLIPANQITASSFLDATFSSWKPSLARLNLNARVNAWRPKANNPHEWLQVDFAEMKRITGIITQGAKSFLSHMMVTEFTISISLDGAAWSAVQEDMSLKEKVFQGNTKNQDQVLNTFDPPLFTRYIRIHPKGWYNDIALRVEFLGCDTQQ
uniref:Coagulation factor VIII n=1 Tax=Lepisosteus oculatus TaxID=7918 RepID=W5N8Q8_LEPOC